MKQKVSSIITDGEVASFDHFVSLIASRFGIFQAIAAFCTCRRASGNNVSLLTRLSGSIFY